MVHIDVIFETSLPQGLTRVDREVTVIAALAVLSVIVAVIAARVLQQGFGDTVLLALIGLIAFIMVVIVLNFTGWVSSKDWSATIAFLAIAVVATVVSYFVVRRDRVPSHRL